MTTQGQINRLDENGQWTPVGWYITVVGDISARNAITTPEEGQVVWVASEAELHIWSATDGEWAEAGGVPDGNSAGEVLVWGANGEWQAELPSIAGLSDVWPADNNIKADGGVMFYSALGSGWEVRVPKVSDLSDGGNVVRADGTVPLTADWNAGGVKISNVQGGNLDGEVVTHTELDNQVKALEARLDALTTGMSHSSPVVNIQNSPPIGPGLDEFYIVGTVPTGDWVGHVNEIAWKETDPGPWHFVAPEANEARLVEAQAAIHSFNGTNWVKVASTSVSGGAAALTMVGEIKQSTLSEAQFKTQMGLAESAKWCLADGRDVTGSGYAVVTGRTHVPDLRGAFIQGAGANNTYANGNVAWNGGTLLRAAQYETGRPTSTQFRADNGGGHTHTMQGAGDHGHDYQTATSGGALFNDPGSYSNLGMSHANNTWYQGGLQRIGYSNLFWGSGDHTHSINGAPHHTHTISGGDVVTKPNSVSLHFYIKIND